VIEGKEFSMLAKKALVSMFLVVLSVTLLACSTAPAPPAPTAAPASNPTAATAAQPTTAAAPATQPTSAPAAPQPTAAAAPKPAGKLESVKYVKQGVTGEGAFFWGDMKGYYSQQGIQLEYITFDSAAKAIPALAIGDVDISAGEIGEAFFNAVGRDLGIKIVGEQSVNSKAGNGVYIMLRKDLADGGTIKGWGDLKGKKVAVSAKRSGNEYILDRALQKAGLTSAKDVDMIELGQPDMIVGFANKAIDAAIMSEPNAQAAVEKTGAVRWKSAPDIVGSYAASLFQAGPKFLANKDLLSRFWKAYFKGAREYYEAFYMKKDRQTAINLLVQNTTLKDPTAYDKIDISLVDPNGDIVKDSVDDQIAWYKSLGVTVPANDKMFDESSRLDVLKEVGRYEVKTP
jgi:NitT/TauT family transport system substrate-binding protein